MASDGRQVWWWCRSESKRDILPVDEGYSQQCRSGGSGRALVILYALNLRERFYSSGGKRWCRYLRSGGKIVVVMSS